MSATAMAASSAAISSVAAANASLAHDRACRILLGDYDAKAASVEHMQEYAQCVERIYPTRELEIPIGAIKACIILVFACAIIGAMRPAFHAEDRIMNAVMWICGSLFFVLCSALVYIGIRFLIEA